MMMMDRSSEILATINMVGDRRRVMQSGAGHSRVNDARRQVDSNSRRPGENLGQTTTDEPELVKKNFVAK